MSKLPAWRLARHAYLDVLGNANGLVRIGGLWLVASWALVMLGRSFPLLAAAADVAIALGAAAVAVAWHRHIIDGEALAGRVAPVDARVLRYFVLTILIALVVGVVPLGVVLLLAGGGDTAVGEGSAGLGLLLIPPVMLACIYGAMRVQLVFPATAIGDQSVTLARSWAVTDGNGWRLVGGFFITALPVALALLALSYLLRALAEATGSIVLTALADLVAVGNPWLQAPLIASFLSYVYLFFRQRTELAPTQ